MRKDAILHLPMSEYCHAIGEKRIVFRLRAARGDLAACTLYYGDTACRKTPIDFFPAPMRVVQQDEWHDWWEVELDSPFHRLHYYFELFDGQETCLFYGDVFTDHLVDDRSEYFKLPFDHRADRAVVPAWTVDAVVYNIFPDSFATGHRSISGRPTRVCGCEGLRGGTLRGVRENLDYLEQLGVNCLYLNPIFVAGAYHKYDTLDYFHVDPALGTDDDLRALVEACHARDMRVMLDGVFNHCSWRFFAFEDVVRRGAASPYRDWFYHLEFPVVRPESGEPIPGYECFGYERTMPKLDTANAQVREYLCRVGEHWVRAFDIDGWRLDVASEIDDGFWREFRRRVKAVKPDCLLVGEVWETARHWLNGDMFDSTMNYDFRKHARRFFAEESIDARAFAGRCGDMLMRYRKQMIPAQLNLLDSHDVSRFLSLCGGDVRRYRLAALFQLTFPGMPSIFYGDELGAMGVREEEYRRAMPWADGDVALWDFFRRAIALRRAHAALRGGSFRVLRAESGERLLVYAREHGGERLTVAINAGEESVQLPEAPANVLWGEGLEDAALAAYSFVMYVG